MASIEKVRSEIARIAQQRKNTTAAEIKWVVDQLGMNGYVARSRKTSDGVLYTVGRTGFGVRRFGVCTHNRGTKQVKACYVDDFLGAMIEIGLYDE
jgi:hypothetical protein